MFTDVFSRQTLKKVSTKAYHPAKKEAGSEKINPKAGERASPPGGKAAAKVEIITRNTKHKNYFLSEKYKEKGKWKRDRRLRTRKKQRREDEAGKQERKVHIIILYARGRKRTGGPFTPSSYHTSGAMEARRGKVYLSPRRQRCMPLEPIERRG